MACGTDLGETGRRITPQEQWIRIQVEY